MKKETNWKKIIKDYLILLGVVFIILLFDQWTKGLVEKNLVIGESWMPWEWLSPYARIVHWSNTGAAFGIFQNGEFFFKILAVIVSLMIFVYYVFVPEEEWPLKVALMLQLAGAIGNLIDRLTIGHVTDFISVGKFAVFNIADASIVMGVVVLVVGMFYIEWKEKKNKRKNGSSEVMAEQIPEEIKK